MVTRGNSQDAQLAIVSHDILKYICDNLIISICIVAIGTPSNRQQISVTALPLRPVDLPFSYTLWRCFENDFPILEIVIFLINMHKWFNFLIDEFEHATLLQQGPSPHHSSINSFKKKCIAQKSKRTWYNTHEFHWLSLGRNFKWFIIILAIWLLLSSLHVF